MYIYTHVYTYISTHLRLREVWDTKMVTRWYCRIQTCEYKRSCVMQYRRTWKHTPHLVCIEICTCVWEYLYQNRYAMTCIGRNAVCLNLQVPANVCVLRFETARTCVYIYMYNICICMCGLYARVCEYGITCTTNARTCAYVLISTDCKMKPPCTHACKFVWTYACMHVLKWHSWNGIRSLLKHRIVFLQGGAYTCTRTHT